jgi:hypothetical protein
MVKRVSEATGSAGNIISVLCSSAGIVFMLFAGFVFVKSNSALATSAACASLSPPCSGGTCVQGTCTSVTAEGGNVCRCVV